MQDFIAKEYLKHSKVPITEEIRLLIKTLFEQNYELPEQVSERRPSYLNFRNVIKWGGDAVNAHTASLSALNSKHGCFSACYKFIATHINLPPATLIASVTDKINNKEVIPGFGNPVISGRDSRCVTIESAFKMAFPGEGSPITFLESVNSAFSFAKGEGVINENLVFWNSFIAYVLGLSIHHASLTFILATSIRYVNEVSKPNHKELT